MPIRMAHIRTETNRKFHRGLNQRELKIRQMTMETGTPYRNVTQFRAEEPSTMSITTKAMVAASHTSRILMPVMIFRLRSENRILMRLPILWTGSD